MVQTGKERGKKNCVAPLFAYNEGSDRAELEFAVSTSFSLHPKILIPLLLLGAALLVVVLLIPRGVDTPEEEYAGEVLRPDDPGPPPSLWNELESEAEVLELRFEESGFQVRPPGGESFFEVFHESLTFEWVHANDGPWHWSRGEATTDQGLQLSLHIWRSPGLPLLLLDVEATLRGESLAESLALTLPLEALEGWILTPSLDEREGSTTQLQGLPIGVGQFSTGRDFPSQVQLRATGKGRLEVVDPGPRGADLKWTLFGGSSQLQGCSDRTGGHHQIQDRLVLQFNDAPALLLEGALKMRGSATPIFVDPPRRSENPWADGRARDSQELARRFRALAMGHSDLDDPRYGNGGLLASGVGAVFAIDASLFDDDPIRDLRRTLEATAIDVVAIRAEATDSPEEIIVVNERSCEIILPEDTTPPGVTILRQIDYDQPYSMDINAPLAELIEVGQVQPRRNEILSRLFSRTDNAGLLVHGEHRLLAIPLIGTRNPLVDSAHEELLTPDRSGHWTLHEDLARALTAWEFEPRHEEFRFLSLGDRSRLFQGPTPFLYFHPDGSFPQEELLEPLLQAAPGRLEVTFEPRTSANVEWTPVRIQGSP